MNNKVFAYEVSEGGLEVYEFCICAAKKTEA